ncbi:efflux RND transporter periplasmic adaptor subunit [Schlegelella sp. S2-27]|uniref:Efflux RND transporter periplasmic adaptor subunit n=1 Tax=Caldimonas mangrovi TaxID=2944811 RepID=A0ABT0YRA3_9BURK|nr:efflux RND transporter periplasmic adaptor subunit [Caldimonas mangrovi]MCM5680373.1 efflux RND transporter periplasmic adaptor subunit [Caldimonas mangrovi]
MHPHSYRRAVVTLALLAAGAVGGYVGSKFTAVIPSTYKGSEAAAPGSDGGREVLYWYDPMVPNQRFDKPGKSPFMDMQLVPKYANEAATGAVAIDPRLAQSLGWRTAAVERRSGGVVLEVPATIQLNERDVAIVQARSGGFVEHVSALAPGDVIAAGAHIADLLVPEWAGAQQEFLAVRATGDTALTDAARQRLVLLGMPASLIRSVEASGKVEAVTAIRAPLAGLVDQLTVRSGMTVTPGMTLARISGLATVWLEASVPEVQAPAVVPGQAVEVRVQAWPDEPLPGKVAAVLPQASEQTRTLRVRIELPNPLGRLRSGMFAQVRFSTAGQEVLVVPAEAVVRTGRRTVVYVVDTPGRYHPVEVELGADLGDRLVVRRGLEAGQQVVASGQFLIDSEASMQGLLPRQAGAAAASVHEGEGAVVEHRGGELTVDHGPIPSLQWGAMEMPFKLAQPQLASGLKPGDRVRFRFVQAAEGYEIREIEPVASGATK